MAARHSRAAHIDEQHIVALGVACGALQRDVVELVGGAQAQEHAAVGGDGAPPACKGQGWDGRACWGAVGV